MDRFERQIQFILEIDKLKTIIRRTYLLNADRAENTAEHSWHLALMAIVLAEHSNEPVNVARVIKMVLVHDIVEIDAGDTFAYDTQRLVDQHEREAAAATRIFGLLPADQAIEFRSLWDEFEDRQTADARFAHAIDRCQAMLLNCLNKGVTWSRHNVRLDQIRARNTPIGDGSAALWTYMSHMLDEAVQAGHVPA